MEGARTRRFTGRLLGGLVGAFLLVGTAFAHSVTFQTSLSIHRSPRGAIERGTNVGIFGALRSGKKACTTNSVVKLIQVGKGVVARDRTGARGRYSFTRKIRHTHNWRTRFEGKVLNGVHPHNHVCASSASRKIRIPVG